MSSRNDIFWLTIQVIEKDILLGTTWEGRQWKELLTHRENCKKAKCEDCDVYRLVIAQEKQLHQFVENQVSYQLRAFNRSSNPSLIGDGLGFIKTEYLNPERKRGWGKAAKQTMNADKLEDLKGLIASLIKNRIVNFTSQYFKMTENEVRMTMDLFEAIEQTEEEQNPYKAVSFSDFIEAYKDADKKNAQIIFAQVASKEIQLLIEQPIFIQKVSSKKYSEQMFETIKLKIERHLAGHTSNRNVVREISEIIGYNKTTVENWNRRKEETPGYLEWIKRLKTRLLG